jgi:hypothetical protein
MYKCNNCGYEFERSQLKYINFAGETVEIKVCPCCKADDYYEMNQCDLCGDYIKDGDYCDSCFGAILENMEDAVDSIQNETGGSRDDVLRAIAEWTEEE